MNFVRRYLCLVLLSFLTLSGQPLQYPTTRKVEHVDTYFGVKVPDPYRWLENDTARDVAEWVEAQNKVTFGYLEGIPFRQKIKERFTKIWNYPKYGAPFRAGSHFFFSKNDGLQNQSVLYIQKSLDETPEVFLDPNKLSLDGTVALSGQSFSKDGRYFAYAISRSGSDWQEIYVIDVETRQPTSDQLKWVKFSDISWRGNGFYYCRYDAPSDTAKKLSTKNEFHKVYYHTIGKDQSDDLLVYEDKDHPLRLFSLSTSEDERFMVLTISQSGSKGNALYYRDTRKSDDTFTSLLQTFDDDISLVNSVDDKLILQTNRNAPNNRLVEIDTKNPEEKNWKELVAEKPEVLSSVTTAGGKLFLTYIKDVSHHVYVYSLAGHEENELAFPVLGTVGGFGGKNEDTFVFYTLTSFTFPPTIYRYDIGTRQSTLYRKPEIDFNAGGYETKQVFYNSKDGTRIPMFIVHKKGLAMDGTNPTLLTGYGGFNISSMPSFSASLLIWLEQGGVFALANLRGGGEYGENWHEAGMGLNKQNVFDDFIAAAEYLIAEKYTAPAKLAIQGGSNGGLLIGAVVNQRPELFGVALPAVGVMDMLRFHKFTIGWAWVPDYGSSDDSVHFRNLSSFSPLHNIRSGVEYPALLATTADHDDRVVPAHSFKYISTLQERYHGNHPTLIRIATKAGHGAGKPTSKVIEEIADIYSFAFYNLGVTPKFP